MAREPLRGCTVGEEDLADVGDPATPQTGGPRPPSAASAADTDQTYAIQPLYVLPGDGADHGLAADGTISQSVSAMQQWLMGQTGGVRLRILTGTVATVRIGETDAQITARGAYVRDRVEQLLRQEGYADPNRLYAVWYDGTSTFSCGGGAWPPDLPGQVAALYLQGRYDSVDCSQDRFSGDGKTV
ncbi:MAG TPA: hypothetical protein VJ735_00235, partial [Actinomycetes bacterium]|nr:hypothetical protein [Actinomycetes bacterium]